MFNPHTLLPLPVQWLMTHVSSIPREQIVKNKNKTPKHLHILKWGIVMLWMGKPPRYLHVGENNRITWAKIVAGPFPIIHAMAFFKG